MLVSRVSAAGRRRKFQFQGFLAMQLYTDQISLVAAKPQPQHHLIVDRFRRGLLGQATHLVALHDGRRDLNDKLAAEEFLYVPEGIDRVCRGLVFHRVIDQELVGGFLDRFLFLFARFLFNDLAITLFQPLALPPLFLDCLGLARGSRGTAAACRSVRTRNGKAYRS
jgi:hypothetical protein